MIKKSSSSRRKNYNQRREYTDKHHITSSHRLTSRDLTITQQESCKSEHEACSTATTINQEACQTYGCKESYVQLSQQMTTMSVTNNLAADQIPSSSGSSNNHQRTALIAGLTTSCTVLALLFATIAGIVFYKRRKLRKILEQQAKDEKEAYIPERPPIIISKIEHVLPPPVSAITRTRVPSFKTPLPSSHNFNDYCHQNIHHTGYDYNHPHSPFVIGAQSLQIPHLDTPDPLDAATSSAFFLRRSLNLQPIKSTETSSYLSRASSVKVSQRYDHYPPSNNLSSATIHSNNDYTQLYHDNAMMQSNFSLAKMATKNTIGSLYATSQYGFDNSATLYHNHPQPLETAAVADILCEQRKEEDDEAVAEVRRAVSVRKNNSTNSHASSITRVGSVTSHASSSFSATKKLVCAKPTVVRVHSNTASKQETMGRKRSIRSVLNQSSQSPFHVTLHDPPATMHTVALRGNDEEAAISYEDDTNRSGINFYFCPPPSLIDDDNNVFSEQNEEEDVLDDEQKNDLYNQFSVHSNASSLTLADGEITVIWEHPTTIDSS